MKETEQTLLDQIKDQVAKEWRWSSWNDFAFYELKDQFNCGKIINEICERYATAKAKPKWYSKQEMYDDLIRNDYSHQIAEELSERWAMDLENARNAGIEKGRYQVQASCEATLKNAAENAKWGRQDGTNKRAIVKASITDPSNIVIVP